MQIYVFFVWFVHTQKAKMHQRLVSMWSYPRVYHSPFVRIIARDIFVICKYYFWPHTDVYAHTHTDIRSKKRRDHCFGCQATIKKVTAATGASHSYTATIAKSRWNERNHKSKKKWNENLSSILFVNIVCAMAASECVRVCMSSFSLSFIHFIWNIYCCFMCISFSWLPNYVHYTREQLLYGSKYEYM